MLFGGSSSKRNESAAPAPSASAAGPSGSAVWFQPDDTFRSFCALLEAPAVSHAHIALIGSQALTASIAQYTATLTHEHIAEFVKLIAISPCLWASAHPDEPSAQAATPATPGAPALPSLQTRTDEVIQAVGQAVAQRIALSIRARYNSTGWQTRRIFANWVSSIIANSLNDVSELAESQDLSAPFELQSLRGTPIARLAICTGLLAGLQGAKAQWEAQSQIGLDVRYHLKLAEEGWVAAFAACLEVIDKLPLSDQQGAAIVPLHCAVQVMPFINSRRLEPLPSEILLRITADRLLRPIESSALLSSLQADIHTDSSGKLLLESSSPTAQRVKVLNGDAAFQAIASLSRILSGTLARLARRLSPDDLGSRLFGILTDVQGASGSSPSHQGLTPGTAAENTASTLLRRLDVFARQLEREWWSSDLSVCSESDLAEPSKAVTKELWNVFKTLLFSYTMIFDSLVDAIVDMCPSPTVTIPVATPASSSSSSQEDHRWGPTSTSNIPTPYLQSMHAVLSTYAHLYWITATFGHDGFDVYRSVFYSSLDVLGRDGEACVALLEALVPHLSYGPEQLQETSTTYFLLVAEQLVAVLPEQMIERLVLPICKPYLTGPSGKDAFESTHSVILAVFAHDKAVVEDLAPFYIKLLIGSFPERLNEAQFEHAFTTVMSAISDRDDALAWWAMELLDEEINKERVRPSSNQSPTSRKLALQLTYAAQITTVNLVLLRSVLAKVRRYILGHPLLTTSTPGLDTGSKSADGTSQPTPPDQSPARQRLAEKAFNALSGLDASTREEGLRWWLANRSAFGV